MALINQNFTIPAGDDDVIEVDITGVNLSGANIEWCVFEQEHGVPIASPVLIQKSSTLGQIAVVPSPAAALVTITHADTHGLLGVYYHELTVIDATNLRSTVTTGLMTVTLTENP